MNFFFNFFLIDVVGIILIEVYHFDSKGFSVFGLYSVVEESTRAGDNNLGFEPDVNPKVNGFMYS